MNCSCHFAFKFNWIKVFVDYQSDSYFVEFVIVKSKNLYYVERREEITKIPYKFSAKGLCKSFCAQMYIAKL